MLVALVVSVPMQVAEAKVPSPLPPASARAELRLTVDRPVVHPLAVRPSGLDLKEDPGFHLTIHNRGRTPLRLIVPQDGSELGWRNPSMFWNVPDLGARPGILRCGNVNPIDAKSFFTLDPGASREISSFWPGSRWLRPGANRVSVTYDVSATREDRGERDFPGLTLIGATPLGDRSIAELYRALTPIHLTSNAVRVTVKPAS